MRLLYVTGSGDVIASYRSWEKAQPEPTQVSVTFSGQIFSFARHAAAPMVVLGTHTHSESFKIGSFLLVRRPRLFRGGRGARFYLSGALHAGRVLAYAVRHRCRDVLVESGAAPLWGVALLSVAGFRVTPIMHNTLWGAGPRPRGGALHAVLGWLDGVTFRRAPAVICVSDAIIRQVQEVSGGRARCIRIFPMFLPDFFEDIPEPRPPAEGEGGPLRLFFAGRIERSKGVFDLLDAAEILEREQPGRFTWELAGDGSAMESLRGEIKRRDLESIVALLGPLPRAEMHKAYARSHAVVVPTRTEFTEGFCMVAAEGVLAGRPVVTSKAVPAHEYLAGACLLAEPDNPASLAQAVGSLTKVRGLFDKLAAAGTLVREQFFDPANGLTVALARALQVRGIESISLPEVAPAMAPEGQQKERAVTAEVG